MALYLCMKIFALIKRLKVKEDLIFILQNKYHTVHG